MPSISRSNSPAPAAPAEGVQQAATQTPGGTTSPGTARAASRPSSQRSEHIPLTRRTAPESAEGTQDTEAVVTRRPSLRAATPTREGASAAASRSSSRDSAMSEAVQDERAAMLDSLGIGEGEIEQFQSLAARRPAPCNRTSLG
ncbi:hypothetical protein CIC12_21815 [Burkholderia sp. SG-MS1]|uniref:hypothetical protein n=1 Tax=Paraburkholderia sp. SG-MS1 TaxID=2023741 RepID=UPI001445E40B|nr:hypothetical protein [Paraburkholderia sp. SG-MS1]NKJ49318.1 hypothetical protein [Paraburkholderia sp. SG-MS1]